MSETKFTVESLAKKIEADNELFDKATPAEKRVIIAKDCLIRIDLGQIVPETGNFCAISFDTDYNIKKSLDTAIGKVCKACAKGSMLMAYLGRVNNFNVSQLHNSNDEDSKAHKKLLEVFDITQLALIEYAFEGHLYIHKEDSLEDLYFDNICKFRSKVAKDNNFDVRSEGFEDYTHEIIFDENSFENYARFDDAILRAICDNIIENNGDFIL